MDDILDEFSISELKKLAKEYKLDIKGKTREGITEALRDYQKYEIEGKKKPGTETVKEKKKANKNSVILEKQNEIEKKIDYVIEELKKNEELEDEDGLDEDIDLDINSLDSDELTDVLEKVKKKKLKEEADEEVTFVETDNIALSDILDLEELEKEIANEVNKDKLEKQRTQYNTKKRRDLNSVINSHKEIPIEPDFDTKSLIEALKEENNTQLIQSSFKEEEIEKLEDNIEEETKESELEYHLKPAYQSSMIIKEVLKKLGKVEVDRIRLKYKKDFDGIVHLFVKEYQKNEPYSKEDYEKLVDIIYNEFEIELVRILDLNKEYDPEQYTKLHKQWDDYLKMSKITPEKMLERYPNHKFLQIFADLIEFKKKKRK